MKLVLDTWERVQLIVVVGSGRGTFAQVELGLRALDVLRLTDEEKASVGYFELGSGQIAWTNDKQHELEFDDDVWRLVQGLVSIYQAWPMDGRVKSLREKVLDGGAV